MEFAARILESVPIDPSAAFRLLHADNVREGYVELGPENRLRTTAPIMRDESSPDGVIMEISAITGNDRGQLDVDLRVADKPVGVETSWYTLRPKTHGAGVTIVPLSAERSIGGKIEEAAAPLRNYFQFAPQIGFYRLIYKADVAGKGAITEIVVGASDRLELEGRTQTVLADFDAYKVADPAVCAVIPRQVGLNTFLAVTVNGQETRLPIRPTVRAAIQAGGGPQRAEDVLPRLSILKPYSGKLAPVEFDRRTSEILEMILLGGEVITWK
jgi:hypothetical protein